MLSSENELRTEKLETIHFKFFMFNFKASHLIGQVKRISQSGRLQLTTECLVYRTELYHTIPMGFFTTIIEKAFTKHRKKKLEKCWSPAFSPVPCFYPFIEYFQI